MKILPIVLYNDPVLRLKAKPVEKNTNELQELIESMFETMYEANGVGLAAPQIGESIRVFVIDADVMTEDEDDATTYGPIAFINPEIISFGKEKIDFEEGCLSLPDLRERIVRPDEISVKYLDIDFKEQTATYKGWMSRVFQHELDHLDGKLFFDHLGSFKQRLLSRKLNLIDEGAVETEYEVRPRNIAAKQD